MRSLRKQLRPLLLASVQAALTGCYQPPPGTGTSTSGGSTSTGASGTSSAGASSAGSTTTGSASTGSGSTGSTGSIGSTGSGSTGAGSTSSGAGSTGSTGGWPPSCGSMNYATDCGKACTQRRTVPAPDGGVITEGNLPPDECQVLCDNFPFGTSTLCAVAGQADANTWLVDCASFLNCTGRRPEGMEPAESSGAGLGNYFAQMAHLEAASVGAFRRLERELAAHGAPQALRARARAAAREEVAHARQMARLAARHGAAVPKVRAAPAQLRSLQELAMENAVEGCVRETYGAALAAYQARTAPDAEARAAFARIADEEASHAELAWDIDAWAQSHLDAEGRAALARARAEAVRELAQALDAPPSPALAPAGVPGPAQARALFDSLAAPLWS